MQLSGLGEEHQDDDGEQARACKSERSDLGTKAGPHQDRCLDRERDGHRLSFQPDRDRRRRKRESDPGEQETCSLHRGRATDGYGPCCEYV